MSSLYAVNHGSFINSLFRLFFALQLHCNNVYSFLLFVLVFLLFLVFESLSLSWIIQIVLIQTPIVHAIVVFFLIFRINLCVTESLFFLTDRAPLGAPPTPACQLPGVGRCSLGNPTGGAAHRAITGKGAARRPANGQISIPTRRDAVARWFSQVAWSSRRSAVQCMRICDASTGPRARARADGRDGPTVPPLSDLPPACQSAKSTSGSEHHCFAGKGNSSRRWGLSNLHCGHQQHRDARCPRQ